MTVHADFTLYQLPARAPALRRPASLIRAARAGQAGFRRSRDLPRLLGRETLPAGPAAIRLLRAAEHHADQARRAGRADYDMHRHVLLLIALLAEMRAAQPAPLPRPKRVAASGSVCGAGRLSVRGTDRPAPRA